MYYFHTETKTRARETHYPIIIVLLTLSGVEMVKSSWCELFLEIVGERHGVVILQKDVEFRLLVVPDALNLEHLVGLGRPAVEYSSVRGVLRVGPHEVVPCESLREVSNNTPN